MDLLSLHSFQEFPFLFSSLFLWFHKIKPSTSKQFANDLPSIRICRAPHDGYSWIKYCRCSMVLSFAITIKIFRVVKSNFLCHLLYYRPKQTITLSSLKGKELYISIFSYVFVVFIVSNRFISNLYIVVFKCLSPGYN